MYNGSNVHMHTVIRYLHLSLHLIRFNIYKVNSIEMYTYFAIHIYISFNLNKTISQETLKFKILFLQIAISCLQKKTFPIFSIYPIQWFSQFVSILASVYKKIYSYYFANIVLTLSTYILVHKFLPYHQIFTKL